MTKLEIIVVALIVGIMAIGVLIPLALREKISAVDILNNSLNKEGRVPRENVRYIVNHKTHTITMVDKK